MVCFGPNDLSVALTGRLDICAKEVKEAMTLVLRKCREMSVMGLIFANDVDYAKPLVAEGWNVVAVGTDAGWFGKAAADMKHEASEQLVGQVRWSCPALCRASTNFRISVKRRDGRVQARP